MSMRTPFCLIVICLGCLTAQPTAGAQATVSEAVTEAMRLRNSGAFAESITLLRAHLRDNPNDGDAIRLLAQTQYWAKDFKAARATYELAVRLHPEDTSLRRQYAQFLAETEWQRGWAKLVPIAHHDDQPLDRLELQAEAGWFSRPAISVALQVSEMRFRLSDTASRNVASAGLAFSGNARESGVRVDLSGGILRRSFGATNELIARGSVSVPVTPALRFRGMVERAGYFHTEASLSRAVMTNTGALFLALNSSNSWLGELSAQLQQYPDDNSLTTAYIWLLAPLAKSAATTFHAGYSGSFQNANELRFELENPNQSVSPASPSYNFAGRYNPYYTPKDRQTHSIIAALAVGLNGPTVFRANGAYAVIGNENAPQFAPVTRTAPARTEARLSMVPRDIHPWNARASLDINLAKNSAVTLGGEVARTGFYSSFGGFASWTLKF